MSILDDINNLNSDESSESSAEAKKIIGIDLGTTYSAIAWINDSGRAEIIQTCDNTPTLASVVYFDSPNHQVVGQEAKNSYQFEPDKIKAEIKREMKNTNWRYSPYEGEEYSPIDISAMILKQLIETARINEPALEGVTDAIITCPAYFGETEHEAIKKAGEKAGLNVLRVLDEPVAAALSYGARIDDPRTVLIYDLGGGTFDVTLVKISEEGLKVILTGGDPRKGGRDWDRALLRLIAEKWKEQTGSDVDMLTDKTVEETLLVVAERMKQALSRRSAARENIAPSGLPDAIVEVTREEFDSITETLLSQTIESTRKLLRDSATKLGLPAGTEAQFDDLVFVGGSTLMPQVAERIRKEFGIEPKIGDPHLAVAKGAALYAQLPINLIMEQEEGVENPGPIGNGNGGGGPVKPPIEEVLGHSYGIIGLDQEGKRLCYQMLLRGQPVATAIYEHRFPTYAPNLASVDLEVTESNEGIWIVDADEEKLKEQRKVDPDYTRTLKKGELLLPPGLPRGAGILVRFNIDESKILHVKASVENSGETIEFKVEEGEVLTDGSTSTTGDDDTNA